MLDLGAGTSFNVLDFFLAADHAVVVVVPEATSVENAYQFLKAAYFRKMRRAQPRDRVRAAVASAMADLEALGIRSPRELLLKVSETDPTAAEALRREAWSFDPALVVNRARGPEHRQLGLDMALACEDYFGRRFTFAGAIEEDELVTRSVWERRPAAERYPESRFVSSLHTIVERLVDGGEPAHGA